MTILDRILETKRREVDTQKRRLPLPELEERIKVAPPVRPFVQAIRGKRGAIIAEIKKASPSRGVLVEQFDPVRTALTFERSGADALSVLTDETYFQGRGEYIGDIRSSCGLPILRKDFIIDEYQLFESRVLGSDAVLLIVRALGRDRLEILLKCAKDLGLDVMVEAHTRSEVEDANESGADLIGINNRDLATFEISIERSLTLISAIRAGATKVSESGIQDRPTMDRLFSAGFDAVLVGEGLTTPQGLSSLLPHEKPGR